MDFFLIGYSYHSLSLTNSQLHTLLPVQSVNEEPVTEWIKQTKALFLMCYREMSLRRDRNISGSPTSLRHL